MVSTPTAAISVVVVVTYRNGTVTIDRFDIHRMAVGANILNSDRPSDWRTTIWNSVSCRCARPLVGIALPAEVRNISACAPDLPCGIAHAFAVIQTPVVNDSILLGICPHARVATAANGAITDVTKPARSAHCCRLLSTEVINLRITIV